MPMIGVESSTHRLTDPDPSRLDFFSGWRGGPTGSLMEVCALDREFATRNNILLDAIARPKFSVRRVAIRNFLALRLEFMRESC